MVMMLLAGMWTLRSIPTQLDPPMNLPYVFVDVEWRGASAEDIAELVTTPIEQQLRSVPELKELRSRTDNGAVEITAEFNFDADMMQALDSVLDDDDGGVDNEAYGNCKASKAHEVGRHPEILHEDEGHQRRERERDGNHERGAQIAEERQQ